LSKYDVVDNLWGEDFLDALTVLPADYLTGYDLSVQAVHQALFCALHLLANGAVGPQIVKVGDKYDVRWLPAMIADEVAGVVRELDRTMPPDLLSLTIKKGRGSSVVRLERQTECLLSYLLGSLVHALSNHIEQSPVFFLFFKNYSYPFNGIGEKAMPGAIRSWLDRFFLAQRQYTPSLLVSENEFGEFALDVAIDREGAPILLKDILREPAMEAQRFAILKELSLLSSLVRGLEMYINRDGVSPIVFTVGEFTTFLFDAIPAIRLLGVKVMLPKSLQEIIRPKVSMKLSKKQTDGKSYLRLDEMLQFDWQVALGNEVVSSQEFSKLISKARGLIKFRQQYIYVNEQDIERLRKAFENDHPMTATQMLQAALTESYDRAPIILSDEVRQLIRQLTEQTDIPVPSGIQATLRPYQERGYSWMYRNFRIGFGSIIADDMGLGKTLQVITLLQKMKDDGVLSSNQSALIVVPTGLVTNWQAELKRFAPSLTVFTYHGQGRNLKEFKDTDILLTTYGVLRSDVIKLKKMSWLTVIIDEAQNIKNADTAQSKAVRSVPAKLHIAMSGTPVENRLSEFWSIMDFANRGYLGSVKGFKECFANPIQRQGDQQVADRFRRITAPFLLRRLKSDKTIISDLPDKIEHNELALLTERQASLYHETLEQAMQAIEGIEATDHQALFVRSGLVLQMILALKQICNHPALFLKNGDFNPELSGKTEMLLSLIESIVESGQKVLVFTQFKEMGEMLRQMIEQRLGEKPLFLHGGCSIKERQAMVDRFQTNSRSDQIFLLSLKAAGTGLNLTAASHVIHYDLWWNPAVEAQATDRAYRIGQHQNVVVHRFITQNTFEERIDQMIQDKRHLADMTVASGESWIGKLSNSELREIFR
jgi:superfamily II DNA or RNA helicase